MNVFVYFQVKISAKLLILRKGGGSARPPPTKMFATAYTHLNFFVVGSNFDEFRENSL